MRRYSTLTIIMLVMGFLCGGAHAQMPAGYVQMVRFDDAFPVIIDEWKAHQGDAAGADAADFDDSVWKPAELGYTWQGMHAVTWFRKALTLPALAQGRPVYVEAMVNDGGELYADGRLLGRFGGQGRFLLTDSADASHVYKLALKGINGDGNAVFTFAGYQISSGSAAENVRTRIDQLRALGRINEFQVSGWKFSGKDSKKFRAPDYDDSDWTPVSLSHKSGSAKPSAWYRVAITVPETMNGFPVAGQKLRINLRFKETAEVYVNGRKAPGAFSRDADVTLTDAAAPGDKFVVAVKVSEFTNDVRMESAALRLPDLDAPQAALDRLATELESVALLFEQHPAPAAAWVGNVNEVLDNVQALLARPERDAAAITEGIAAIEEKMKPTAALIERFPLFIKGPYLQNVTQESIVVMWQTAAPASACVLYGKAGYEQKVCRPSLETVHEITLPGLETETQYHYTAVTGELASPDAVFRTAPRRDTPFKFDVWGDSRTDYRTHQSVVRAMMKNPPDIALNVGDVVTHGANYGEWGREHFLPIRSMGFTVPTYISIGNHEYGGFGNGNPVTWFEQFVSQPGNEYYFAITYGNSRFIILNPQEEHGPYNVAPGTAQYDWLIKEFESGEYKNATFHFVFLHEPPYSEGWSGGYYDGESSLRINLVPLLEKYGVDMLFAGHTHDYERGRQNGTYYIITGGGGSSLDDTIYYDWPHIELVRFIYHFSEIKINGTRLEFKAIDRNGKVFDEFVKEK